MMGTAAPRHCHRTHRNTPTECPSGCCLPASGLEVQCEILIRIDPRAPSNLDVSGLVATSPLVGVRVDPRVLVRLRLSGVLLTLLPGLLALTVLALLSAVTGTLAALTHGHACRHAHTGDATATTATGATSHGLLSALRTGLALATLLAAAATTVHRLADGPLRPGLSTTGDLVHTRTDHAGSEVVTEAGAVVTATTVVHGHVVAHLLDVRLLCRLCLRCRRLRSLLSALRTVLLVHR